MTDVKNREGTFSGSFHHINYYFLIKSTRETHLKIEDIKLSCHIEITVHGELSISFSFPHASLWVASVCIAIIQ